MLNHFKRLFLITIIIGVCSCGNKHAQLIPIGDFFNPPSKGNFHISPTGKYLSYLKRENGKQIIVIQTLADGKQREVNTSADYPVRDYFWTYNDQIILTNNMFGQESFEMFALNANTLKTDTVLSIAQKTAFRLLSRNRTNPNIITFAMNKRAR